MQAVRPLSAFWSDSSTPLQTTSPLASSFRRVMAKLDSSKSCVDPSFFLTSLTNSLRKSGRASFDINTQQDAVEILEHILSELLGGSAVASRTLSIKILTDISCNSCFQSSPTEDCCVILQLPVRANIQSSLNSLFISECLEGVNAPFCHVCSSKQDADSHLYICEVGNYLIVQLKRFLVIDGVVSKYAAPVICTPYLDVPVRVDDEVSCVKKFALVSGICHSGSLHSGHYTAFARDDVCGSWLHLNDKAVTRTTLKALNGPLPYVLFYKAC